jgi:heat shock protein HtpX
MGRPPVLVYERVDENRRHVRLLLLLFVVLLLPFVAFWVQYMMAWFSLVVPDIMSLAQRNPAVGLATAGGVALGVSIAIVLLEYALAERVLLRLAGARPADPTRERGLLRRVENLCIGCGLPRPRVHVVESDAANAFSTGISPKCSHLVVTRGLLTTLEERRELEAVIAHELAHIGNGDARLGTLLAALVATLWLPARLVVGVFRRLFGLHRILGALAALWCASLVVGMLVFSVQLIGTDPVIGGILMLSSGLLLYGTLGAPLLALLVARAMTRERDLLADAEAVLLTRNPEALGHALGRISAAALPPLHAGPATAHLHLVPPEVGGGRWWQRAVGRGPAETEERIARTTEWGLVDLSDLETTGSTALRERLVGRSPSGAGPRLLGIGAGALLLVIAFLMALGVIGLSGLA